MRGASSGAKRPRGSRLLKPLLLVAHLAWGIALAAWLGLGARASREVLAQRWHRRLLAILGVELRVEGLALREPHMTVANHVSWLDIPVLGALEATRFVGKSEIKDWPVAGWLASAGGTFFLRRGSGGSAPLINRLVPHLRAHGSVTLFPEGTTTDGSAVLPFHARLFAAAIAARCPVQPVTIQYGFAADGANIAPFIGNDSLAGHIVRLLRCPKLEVRVMYGPPLHPHASRDELAREAESLVRAALQPPRAGYRLTSFSISSSEMWRTSLPFTK
jgi:1-acyl-sn-glycerol-3-phosphate acyltransferase